MIFGLKKREYMTKLVVSKYRSIGSQSIGDTGTKNRAGTTDTSIPIGMSTCFIAFVLSISMDAAATIGTISNLSYLTESLRLISKLQGTEVV